MSSIRDRIEASQAAELEAQAALAEANQQRVADKRARQSDDSGDNTALPGEKSSC